MYGLFKSDEVRIYPWLYCDSKMWSGVEMIWGNALGEKGKWEEQLTDNPSGPEGWTLIVPKEML